MMPGKLVRDTDVARTGSQRYRCSLDRQAIRDKDVAGLVLEMQMMPGKVVRDTDDARKGSQRYRCSQDRKSEIQM
jgi:hypothetical protein